MSHDDLKKCTLTGLLSEFEKYTSNLTLMVGYSNSQSQAILIIL